MRRTALVGATSVLFLGLAGVVSVSAVSQAAGPDATDSTTLNFDVQFSPFTIIEANNVRDPNSPIALGDENVFHDLLFQKGKQVGDDVGSCVIVAVTPEVLGNCSAVFRLPDGNVSAQFATGPGPAPKPLTLTGGTGAYSDIGGEGTLVEFGSTQGSDRGTLTLHVLHFKTKGGKG
jgi:hypothetical protein